MLLFKAAKTTKFYKSKTLNELKSSLLIATFLKVFISAPEDHAKLFHEDVIYKEEENMSKGWKV